MTLRDKLRGDMLSRMRRYPAEGWIAGVCVGLATYFDWNTKLIRLLFFLVLIFGGFFPACVVYMLLWYLMDEDYGAAPTASATTPSSAPGAPPTSDNMRPRDLKARFSQLEYRLACMEECVVSKDFELRRAFRKLES